MTTETTQTTPKEIIEKIKNVQCLVRSRRGNPSLKKVKWAKVTKMKACEGGGHALSGTVFAVLNDMLCEAEKYLEENND